MATLLAENIFRNYNSSV